MPTDAKGEYRLNSYGSKERPAGDNAWVLYSDDMSQAEIDARAAESATYASWVSEQAVAAQAKAEREAKLDALIASKENIDAVISKQAGLDVLISKDVEAVAAVAADVKPKEDVKP